MVAVGVSKNGFIVTAHPIGREKFDAFMAKWKLKRPNPETMNERYNEARPVDTRKAAKAERDLRWESYRPG